MPGSVNRPRGCQGEPSDRLGEQPNDRGRGCGGDHDDEKRRSEQQRDDRGGEADEARVEDDLFIAAENLGHDERGEESGGEEPDDPRQVLRQGLASEEDGARPP